LRPPLHATITALFPLAEIPPDSEADAWVSLRCVNPGHDDTQKSASVNFGCRNKRGGLGAYNCHGCQMHGDAVDLILQAQGFTRPRQAFEWADANVSGYTNDGCRNTAGQAQDDSWRHVDWHST
jgi:hypothetical protein